MTEIYACVVILFVVIILVSAYIWNLAKNINLDLIQHNASIDTDLELIKQRCYDIEEKLKVIGTNLAIMREENNSKKRLTKKK